MGHGSCRPIAVGIAGNPGTHLVPSLLHRLQVNIKPLYTCFPCHSLLPLDAVAFLIKLLNRMHCRCIGSMLQFPYLLTNVIVNYGLLASRQDTEWPGHWLMIARKRWSRGKKGNELRRWAKWGGGDCTMIIYGEVKVRQKMEVCRSWRVRPWSGALYLMTQIFLCVFYPTESAVQLLGFLYFFWI